jgi:hypothetical protein
MSPFGVWTGDAQQTLLSIVRRCTAKHKPNNGADSPLVAQIKSEISEKTDLTRQRLTRNCTVEDVAGSIHEIYVVVMDLGITVILKHSEKPTYKLYVHRNGKPR